MFQYKSTVTGQEQEALQDEELETSETFADASSVVAESRGAWSLEVGCCCR